MVMQGDRIHAGAECVATASNMRQRVATTRGSIGYEGLGFLDQTVKPIAINGVVADRTTVARNQYPLVRPLCLVTDGYPVMGSPLHAFVRVHLTPPGEEIIRRLGFVPTTSYEQ